MHVKARWGVLLAIGSSLLSPTVAAGWSSPTDLSARGNFDSALAVAVNQRGDTVVAWQRRIDDYHSVMEATIRPAGGTWSAPQTLSIPEDWQNTYPSVAIDARGDALVVWGATNGQSLGETRAAYAPAGQPFQSPVQVGATYNGNTGDAYPFVGFDGAGNAIAFWLQNDNRVYYAVRPAHGAFGAANQVPHVSSDQGASYPSYAVASNGEAVAAWEGYAVIRNADGTFDPPQALGDHVQSGPVHVAMDAHGDAIAVWAEQINNQGYMKAALRPAGGSSFGTAATVAQVPYTGNDEANVAMDAAGDATIAWPGESSSPYVNDGPTVVVHRAGSTGFGAPQSLGGGGAEEPPSVVYDAAGNPYVVWRHYDTNTTTSITGHVLAEKGTSSGTFGGNPDAISSGEYNVWPGAVAAGGANTAVAVWPVGVFNGDASQFWIQESDAAGTPDTPTSQSTGTGAGTGLGTGAAAGAGAGATGSGLPAPANAAQPSSAAGPSAISAGAKTLNTTAAARACTGRHPLSAALGARDAVFLGRYITCVTRQERAQIGLGYRQSSVLSGMIHGALGRFFASTLRVRHQLHRVDLTVGAAARTMASKACHRAVAMLAWAYGDTSPPPLTPLKIARALAVGREGKLLRSPGAIFGVGSRAGLVFLNHDRHGSMFMWVGVMCR